MPRLGTGSTTARTCAASRESVALRWRAPPSHSSAFFAKFAAELTPRREWRAHTSAVQSLSVCYTVAAQQPSLLSSGDDGHVRLWDMSGACVGSLAQVSVDDLMCRFLN